MKQINVKAIFRNLVKGKYYSFINILGLAIGITCSVWAFQNIRFANSFDDFHENKDQIYRVLTKRSGSDLWHGYCPYPLPTFAKQQYSSVTESVRLQDYYLQVRGEVDQTLSANVHFTDPAFFDFFNFPLVKGVSDLSDQSAVLLTETEAKKFFGNEDPIGKTLTFYTGEVYQKSLTVKGILKDCPYNSAIQFGILTNLANLLRSNGQVVKSDDWSYYGDVVFLKIPDKTSVTMLEGEFDKYAPLAYAARKDRQLIDFKLDPLPEVSKHENDLVFNALYTRPGKAAVFGVLILALLILLSACLNFVNTTVAKSNNRLKEMGVRKVLGGSKSQLITQQLIESSVIVFLALILSTLFTHWWLPTYNGMFDGILLEANYLRDPILLKFMGGVLVGVTLIAGLYPAFYISRFNPSQIFRGGVAFGGSNFFSKILLGFQILIAFITLSASFGFSKNAKFQQDFDLGFDKSNIVGLWIDGRNLQEMKDEVNKIPEVVASASTYGHFGFAWNTIPVESEGNVNEIRFIETGTSYLDLMGVQFIAGQDFNGENIEDVDEEMVVTEKLCRQFGWSPNEAIGKRIKKDTFSYSIIGVTKDLYIGGFFGNLNPLAIVRRPEHRNRLIIIKSSVGDQQLVLDKVKAAWIKLFPSTAFSGFYQDEMSAEAKQVNASVTTLFFWFSIISILFTITGMFALMSLTIIKKNKEIAVRKVVGATLANIFVVINKSYFPVFIIAAGLGIYAGAYLTKLLMDLIFTINTGFNSSSMFSTFFGICVLIVVVVGFKLWQVNKMKPSVVLQGN